MAALLTLFSLLLSMPSHADVRAQARGYVRAGQPDVAKIYRLAAPEYRSAIATAIAEVDPEGAHPEWEWELWRICRREAWCGHYGPVGVHKGDGWAGVGVYAGAVSDGLLDPVSCPAHRLEDYNPVRELVQRRVNSGRWSSRRAARALAGIDQAEVGTRLPADFSTRGGWGQMQARQLHKLGSCVAPEVADDPAVAARLAALSIASCQRWEGPPGARTKRHCTCAERTRKWVGGGRWDQRTLWRNAKSVSSQCGDKQAVAWAVAEIVGLIHVDGAMVLTWALVGAPSIPG
jgi:hypothetical protein